MRAKLISTGRLTAAIGQSLTVNHTRGRLVVRGTEGVRLAGARIQLAADQTVWLRSLNGSVVLDGAHGVHINVAGMAVVGEHGIKLPATTHSSSSGSISSNHYKLCVCMPHGRVFRVPVPALAGATAHVGTRGLCAHFSAESNPCA